MTFDDFPSNQGSRPISDFIIDTLCHANVESCCTFTISLLTYEPLANKPGLISNSAQKTNKINSLTKYCVLWSPFFCQHKEIDGEGRRTTVRSTLKIGTEAPHVSLEILLMCNYDSLIKHAAMATCPGCIPATHLMTGGIGSRTPCDSDQNYTVVNR